MPKVPHVIEEGDVVNILHSDYENDGIWGPAEVLQIDDDELLLSLLNRDLEVWVHIQRIKR